MNCRTSVKASRLVKLHDGLPRKASLKTKELHKFERLCWKMQNELILICLR
jgi:hypothetical protein